MFEQFMKPKKLRPSMSGCWELIKEIDQACKEFNFTDWELRFTSDMMDKVKNREMVTSGQITQIERLHEKYCS